VQAPVNRVMISRGPSSAGRIMAFREIVYFTNKWSRGSIPRRGKILFSITSRPSLGPTQPPIHWVPAANSSKVKRKRRGTENSPILVPRLSMVELYLHSPVRLHDMELN
jgi:hypothetical protein